MVDLDKVGRFSVSVFGFHASFCEKVSLVVVNKPLVPLRLRPRSPDGGAPTPEPVPFEQSGVIQVGRF